MPVDLSSDLGGTTRRRATDAASYVAGGWRTQRAEDGAPELATAVERLHAAGEHQHCTAFRDLVEGLKQAQEAGRFEELAAALRSALTPMLDYTSAQSLNRFYRALPASLRGLSSIKLAILGGFTTHQLRVLIELYLFAAGISAEIYEADYGVFRQEILDPSSDLYHFEPGVIFLATHWRNIGHLPALTDPAEKVAELLEAEYREWALLWETAHQRLGSQVLQNNFDPPPWRSLGNHEMRHPSAPGRFIAEINRMLAERAPPYVTIHDVEGVAASIGRRAWGDERFFVHAKMPCAPEHLVEYAHSVSSILAAHVGHSRKCLVMDLDNTLWGGVIGDDGIGGIRLGQGGAEGEAFLSFQRYAQALRTRGVILAVCSKNDERVAREVFEKHPEMVLRLDDISCFVANWMDKATNLKNIARDLNIGLDSLVVIDDNPAERSIIRQMTPEVAVPEISEDPINFIEVLERHRYFQVATLGVEDYKRTGYYRANAERRQLATSAGAMDEFLRSLTMTAVTGPIESATIERSAQLINKSNQFNLTTRRRTVAEVLALTRAPDWVTVTVSLADRFGDNGLISVVLACVRRDALEIDTWVMSCRVLKRSVERFLLNFLCKLAGDRGLGYIRGEYVPTTKNGLVRDHYAELGFANVQIDSTGRTVWQLSLCDFAPLSNFIEEAEADGPLPRAGSGCVPGRFR
jgi:FkbH-like protein